MSDKNSDLNLICYFLRECVNLLKENWEENSKFLFVCTAYIKNKPKRISCRLTDQ